MTDFLDKLDSQQALSWLMAHAVPAAVAAAGVVALLVALWHAARRVTRGRPAEDVLTFVTAGLATTVAMTGMYRFFGVVLHFDNVERALLFGVLEFAVITSAFRARRNMRDFGSSGADGAAMWVLTCLSGVLAAMAARSLAEAAFRLAAPLVAAWLWHRGLALERRRSTEQHIHWRLTPERLLVRLGLADPTAQDVSEVAGRRRIVLLARATNRYKILRSAGVKAESRRLAWAVRRQRAAMEKAIEFGNLASDPLQQDALLEQIAALGAALTLADGKPVPPWSRRPQRQRGDRLPETGQPPLPPPGDEAGASSSLTRAIEYVLADPGIKGDALGEKLGVKGRMGRYYRTRADQAIAAGAAGSAATQPPPAATGLPLHLPAGVATANGTALHGEAGNE